MQCRSTSTTAWPTQVSGAPTRAAAGLWHEASICRQGGQVHGAVHTAPQHICAANNVRTHLHPFHSPRPPCLRPLAATSTHWHGLLQRNTAWADGVATVSQSSYAPGNTFRYSFTAEPAGTFWYHAHTGVQFADGLRGPLIIQDPKDPYRSQYDDERVLMVYDQAYLTAEEELRALQTVRSVLVSSACMGEFSAPHA